MPEVSVVIPTYNRAEVLSRAIDSALGQTVADIEVLVVDDASTDETPELIERYDDPRVRYFRHEENRNGAAARNTGIDAARGEYIAFLDSDDEWLPSKLERQLDHFRSKPAEWVAVYCDIFSDRSGLQKTLYELVTRIDPSFEKRTLRTGGEELVDEIHADRFTLGGLSTLVVEREAVNAVNGFDPAFPRHQDLEFLVRLLGVGKLAVVSEPLVVRHSTGLPDLADIERAKRLYFEKFAERIQLLESNGVPVRPLHRFSMARYFYQRGRFRRGTQYLRRAKAPRYADYLRLLWSCGIGVQRRLGIR